ncbi:hypothetical protein pzkkv8_138 [Klebsiella phage pzk-kv8]|nr:hypothetical protein pzkkv8_138 [Klebsiella phage pzk-kv8]
MDLFEMFEEAAKEPEPPYKDLIDELDITIQKHGINLPPSRRLVRAGFLLS